MPKVTRICLICGKEFQITNSVASKGGGKYCSRECNDRSKIKEKIEKVCPICGKKFDVRASEISRGGGKYCSINCYNKSRAMKRIKKICPICGKEFETFLSYVENDKGKYCSLKCSIESKKRRIKRICPTCGKEFETTESSILNGKGKYCSRECVNNIPTTKVNKICIVCGNEFEVYPYRSESALYCSYDCYHKDSSMRFIGENNPNWMGGTKEYCEKFNNPFKRRVLAFWYLNNQNICPVCEEPIIEETPHCHHSYYDKKSCCLTTSDGKYFCNLGIKNNEKTFEIIGDPNKFVPLHCSCHGKTNNQKEREFYARKFETLINEKFGGKSYFTEEEYKEFLIYHPEWKIPYKHNKKIISPAHVSSFS
jgi:hypothetical protein